MTVVHIRSYPQEGRRMLFVLPPAQKRTQKIRPSHHPIMTATLVATAIAQHAHVGVIDAALLGLSHEELLQIIVSWQPEWIGFVPFEYRRELPLEGTLELVSLLRSRGCTAQMGVLNASWGALEPRRAVEQQKLDFVAFGDCEPTISSLANSPKSPPAGVLWRLSGYLEENTRRPQVDWEQLPIPAWFLFDYHAYIPSAHRYKHFPTLPVFASRSCPYGCDFCPQSLFNPSQKHSTRPPEKVFAEVKVLHEHYGAKDIEFYDPTFGIKREDTLVLCTLMKSLGVSWSCYSRCDILDEQLIAAMAASGCHTILFGVESADEEVRGRTNKELSHAEIQRAFSLCAEYGIHTIASFILGLPKETPHTLKRTLRFARTLNPTYAQFHLARAFFDHEDWLRHGTIHEEWDVTDASVNGKAYTPHGFDQKSLHRWLMRSYLEFYLRPKKIAALAHTIQSPADIRRYLRGMYQISHHLLGQREA